MDITILIQSIVGLVAILGVLAILLVSQFSSKEVKIEEVKEESPPPVETNTDFQHLQAVVNDNNSSTEELSNAMSLIIKRHGTMRSKLGMRPHPESDAYMDVLFKACRHKNINKDIIIKFNNSLEKLNPGYKKEINEALMRGLNSRGV